MAMTKRNRESAVTVSRATRHRQKLAAAGAKRVEVTVPGDDTGLVRELAATLRAGGVRARKLRASLRSAVRGRKAASGRDLVAFFRASPLVGEELEFGRDRSTGRETEL